MSIVERLKPLWQRHGPDDGPLLVLEWRAQGLLALLADTRRTRSPWVLRADFRPCTPDTRASALAQLASLQRWGSAQRTVLLLGSEQRQLSMLPRPRVEPAELREATRWQLAGALDYPAEEAVLDLLPVGRDGPPERQQLLVFAVHRPLLAAAVAPLAARRLRIEAVDVVDCAQRNLVALHSGGNQPLAALSLRDGQILLTVSLGGELVLSRSFEAPEPASGRSVDERIRARDDEALAERVGLQLQRLLDSLERRASHWMPSTLLLLPHSRRQELLRLCAELTGLRVAVLDLQGLMPELALAARGGGARTAPDEPDPGEFAQLLGSALRPGRTPAAAAAAAAASAAAPKPQPQAA